MSKSTLNKFPVLRIFITFYEVFYDIYGKTSRFHYFYCLFSDKGASGRNSAVGIPLTSGPVKQAAFPARQYSPRITQKRWQKSCPPGELSWAKYLNLPGTLPHKQRSRWFCSVISPVLTRAAQFEPVSPTSQSAAENFFWSFTAVFHRFCSFSPTF